MFHRVFAHLQGPLWMGVEWMAERQPITSELEYVTLPMVNPSHEVCITLPDGRILCDFGPDHVHSYEDTPQPDGRHPHWVNTDG